ncbi:MAG: hypothetical protein J7641_13135 [Cyanobacteria bacterium SID2]|nr:hypothetical protein [Cyanobacteria bacterium SID2]
MSYNPNSEQWVGIDVNKHHIDIYLRPAGKIFQFPNNSTGRVELLSKLKTYTIELILVGSTGGVERPVLESLTQAGLPTLKVKGSL